MERLSVVEEGDPDVVLTASYSPILHKGTKPMIHSELFTMEELGGIQGIAQWLNILGEQESLVNPY